MLHEKELGSFIHGEFEKTGKKTPYPCFVTKKPYKDLLFAEEKTVEKALKLTDQLSLIPPYERANLIKKLASLLAKNKKSLAETIVKEMGKSITDAEGEIEYSIGYLDWYQGEITRIYGNIIPSRHADKKVSFRYEPIGPCAFITPWNFPIAMPVRNVCAALAAGCPAIVKPAPETPISMLALAKLIDEAGFPKGSCNVVLGDEVMIGKKLLEAKHIKKFGFTGSTEVGKLLYAMGAPSLKKATLELGGNAPYIVFDDADIDLAVSEALKIKFRNSGQSCTCANRFLIQEGVYQEFIEKFTQAVSAVPIGDPFDKETVISNFINEQSIAKGKKLSEDAKVKGATFHLKPKNGLYPQIISDVTPTMDIYSQEIFSPISSIMPFKSVKEVISIANDTEYGLAAYVFTNNLQISEQVISKLQFGIIGLNDALPHGPELPFGGVKDSGFGREGGPTGIYEYLTIKSVSEKMQML